MELHFMPHSLFFLFLSLLYSWQSIRAIGGKGTWKHDTSFYQHLTKLDPGTFKVYQEPAGQRSGSERDPLPVACNIISDTGRSQSILTIKMIVVWAQIPC